VVKYDVVKNGPGHDDFNNPKPYYLSPAGQYYANPVVVLTNRSCFSACNDFALYMSGISIVKLIGDQTGGGGGIPNNYLLANGWKLQYSATITLSPVKDNIENGIPPYVNIEISSTDELNGKDPILEKALQFLQ
jgi:C-terminal processing protease CtpA/Prc